MSLGVKIFLAVLGLIAILISVFIVRTYSSAGQYTSLPTYGTQKCTTLSPLNGVEDMVVDREAGLVYFSVLNRRKNTMRGQIFVRNMNDNAPEKAVTRVIGEEPKDFDPQGLSLYKAEDGTKYLFVVNRSENRAPTVEMFKQENWLFTHVKTLSSPLITTPNNIVAVGAEQFYLTNDGVTQKGFMQTFLDFANQNQKGNVIYFDGKTAREVASGFVSPHGIAASPDGQTIYVNDMHARTLKFFKRADNDDLEEVGDLFVGTGLDNIDVDDKGHLWIAAHPKLFDFYRYKTTSQKMSPSQIIEAVPGDKEGGKMRTVFLDTGERLSGSSIGVRYGDKLLVSGPYEGRVITCDIPQWTQDKKK